MFSVAKTLSVTVMSLKSILLSAAYISFSMSAFMNMPFTTSPAAALGAVPCIVSDAFPSGAMSVVCSLPNHVSSPAPTDKLTLFIASVPRFSTVMAYVPVLLNCLAGVYAANAVRVSTALMS